MKTSTLILSNTNPDGMIRNALKRITELENEINALRNKIPVPEQFIRIHQGQNILKISVNEILYLRSDSNYSRIYLKSGTQYLTCRTLKYWEGELPINKFTRCHRSYLVNKNELRELHRGKGDLLMSNGDVVPTSRRNQKSCTQILLEITEPARKKSKECNIRILKNR